MIMQVRGHALGGLLIDSLEPQNNKIFSEIKIFVVNGNELDSKRTL